MRDRTKIYYGLIAGLVVMTGVFFIVRRNRMSSFKKRLIDNTIREWKLWGKPTRDGSGGFDSGSTECTPIYEERVGEYWKKGTGKNLDGCDRSTPWSSAFISFVMKKSGAGDDFVYSSAHNKYIRPFIQNRKQNNKSPFKAYKLSEKSVQVGDLICYSRQSNVNYDTTSSYKSHCDIVVDVNKFKKTAEVIGGNVSDGVTKRIVNLNSQGNLTDTSQDWFTIIKNKK